MLSKEDLGFELKKKTKKKKMDKKKSKEENLTNEKYLLMSEIFLLVRDYSPIEG